MKAARHTALCAACVDVGKAYRRVPTISRWREIVVHDDQLGQGDGRIKLFPDHEGEKEDWSRDAAVQESPQ